MNDKLKKDLLFPIKGDYFAVITLDKSRDTIGGEGVKTVQSDRSYRNYIFKCVAADTLCVVGIPVVGPSESKPIIFFRTDYRFDNVDNLKKMWIGVDMFKCFFGHDWTKWTLYPQERKVKSFWEAEFYPYTEKRQRRECKRCGKTQDEKVGE